MAFTNEQLAAAIFTANAWSADHGDGLQLLSLGTTRRIHSEDHRRKVLAEIDANIKWVDEDDDSIAADNAAADESGDDWQNDLANLRHLRLVVEQAVVGQEWLSDADNLQISEKMYREGRLR